MKDDHFYRRHYINEVIMHDSPGYTILESTPFNANAYVLAMCVHTLVISSRAIHTAYTNMHHSPGYTVVESTRCSANTFAHVCVHTHVISSRTLHTAYTIFEYTNAKAA
jgi:hypothetical protein